jgi:hypothetical protein
VLVPLAVVTLYMGILPARTMDIYALDLDKIVEAVKPVAKAN